MTDVPAKNTPMLAGWAMAAGFGAVATGVGYLAMGLGGNGAVFVGAVIFSVTGIILGLPVRNLPGPGTAALPMDPVPDRPVSQPVAVSAPAMVAPATVTAPEPPVAPVAVAAPVVAAPAARPAGLATARDGRADDLKIIKGIGPKLEELCHRLGYYHFDQIAGWTAAEVAWVDDNLEGFKGRVTRDRWVPQAKAIMSVGKDEFLKRLDGGETF